MALRPSLRASLLASLLFWAGPTVAYAQAPTSIQENIAWLVTWIISALNIGIWIIFIMLVQVLDTAVIFDNQNMANILNEVWQLSRNVMNILFAVILIGAAVYTVVTAKKDLIATHLPKFVAAVVLVNFSWFIPRVIIDVANVAAATVYDIPSMITNVKCEYRTTTVPNGVTVNGIAPTCVPGPVNAANPSAPVTYTCPCMMATDAEFFVDTQKAGTLNSADGWTPFLADTMFVQIKPIDSVPNRAAYSTVLNGLILNHARLMGLASVPPTVNNSSDPQVLIMFLLQMAVILLLHVALFFPLAAMLLAMTIRIPILWLTIAFMPVMVLQFVIPGQLMGEFGEYPKKIWDHFLKAAFLPAIVGVPLTVGFIMTNAAQKANLFAPVKGIQFRLTDSIGDYWELLWLIMTIGIIWVGVFSTLEKMGIMGKGSQAIRGAGEQLGRLAVKAPLSLPIIPGNVPFIGGMSILGARGAGRRLEASMDSGEDFGAAMGSLRGGAGNTGDMALSAKKHAKSDEKMTKLTEHMDKLADAIENGKDRTGAVDGIKTDLEFKIRPDHASEDLTTYRQKLETEKASPAKITEINARIKRIEEAEKKVAPPKTP